jgi:tetratricopeptide (TPR) repeat protein
LAISYIDKAISLYKKDLYYRALSEIYLIKVNQIIKSPSQEGLDDVIEITIRNGEQAIEADPNNYENWVNMAKIYTSLAYPPVSLAKGYEAAKSSYQKAISLNPDYAPSYFLLAQNEIVLGENVEAMRHLNDAIDKDPKEPGYFLQLGILKYKQSDYGGAIESIKRAVALVPDYADARYFLGLSYYYIGDSINAKLQFEEILKNNSDNKEVINILDAINKKIN